MINRIAIILPLILVFASGLTNAQVVKTTPTAEVLEAVHQYDQAWQHRDTSKVASMLESDYVYFSSRGTLISKTQTISDLASPKYVLETAERSEIEVRLIGTTAIVSSRWRGHGTWEGKPFNDDQRCSLVFVKIDSRWRLVAEHCTQIQKQ